MGRQGRDGHLGLLPDAQPCTPDPRAVARGRAQGHVGGGAPAVHPHGQFPRGLARLPVAGAVSQLCHGRNLACALRALCGAESRGGGHGGASGGLALVVHAGACGRADDGIVRVAPLLERVGDWAAFMEGGVAETLAKRVEKHLGTGRPLGSEQWITAMETRLGKRLDPLKRGPKRHG